MSMINTTSNWLCSGAFHWASRVNETRQKGPPTRSWAGAGQSQSRRLTATLIFDPDPRGRRPPRILDRDPVVPPRGCRKGLGRGCPTYRTHRDHSEQERSHLGSGGSRADSRSSTISTSVTPRGPARTGRPHDSLLGRPRAAQPVHAQPPGLVLQMAGRAQRSFVLEAERCDRVQPRMGPIPREAPAR